MRMTALLVAAMGLCWTQQAKDPALEPVQDVPGLPRMLLIGDSISMGYTMPVRAALAGSANVHRIPENGASTKTGVERIDGWLGDAKWDLITFNFGLHDLKVMEDGRRQVSLAEYENNLTLIAQRLKKTGAKVIFVLTTPVPEGPVNPMRRPSDVAVYNGVARRVMESEGIGVVDLYTFALPRLKELQKPVNVHFTDEGYEALAGEVARAIRRSMGKEQPHALDFCELYVPPGGLTSTGVQNDASGTAETRAVDVKQRIKVSIDSPVADGTVYVVVTKTANGAKVLGSLTINLGIGELELVNNKGKADPNATDPFCTIANVAVVDGNLQAILFGPFWRGRSAAVRNALARPGAFRTDSTFGPESRPDWKTGWRRRGRSSNRRSSRPRPRPRASHRRRSRAAAGRYRRHYLADT